MVVVFNYGSGHTVDEVSESDYNSCTVGKPISTNNSGSTNVSLSTAGTHYYICGVIGHCGSGMKLAVTATAGGGPVAEPSGSPPPTGTTTTATPPPPTTYTEPPSSVPAPSSSGVLSPFVAMMCTWQRVQEPLQERVRERKRLKERGWERILARRLERRVEEEDEKEEEAKVEAAPA
ncbi:hypothetical protein RHMOL_Rhmol07G0263900 [Rhododendron molle]|uniref:Uncharacterized protein n=1 Tax=Rhododendron molle TaxID=49168 RepID=A0ACC0N552_RHOML|nr:hypothetical protein RHMOL_Rhmol07G0263900 [Rhododendron molle]